jgi:hypothetical protein
MPDCEERNQLQSGRIDFIAEMLSAKQFKPIKTKDLSSQARKNWQKSFARN